jgi:hypothetical protein
MAVAGEYALSEEGLRSLDERIASEERRLEEVAQERRETERLAKIEEAAKAEAAAKAAAEAKAAAALKEELARKNEAERLLGKAQGALARNRLMTPSGDNAAEYAAQLLSVVPGHPGARRVLMDIVGRYVALGEVALGGGQVEQAREYERQAQGLVKRYGLPDSEVKAFAGRLAAQGRQPTAPLAGDPDSDRAELERLRREMEAMRQRSSPAQPTTREDRIFIPPSF